jgi:pimeloyl-ACP methyl ester carboxylesterase
MFNFSKLPQEDNFIAYQQQKTQTSLPGVIFLSGFHSDMNGTKALALSDIGQYTTYTRFDYFGHGSSSGNFIQGTIGHWLKDCLAILDNLTEGKQILVGSSMGGWLMFLVALLRPERICGLVGLAAAPDFTEDLIWNKLSKEEQQKAIAGEIITLGECSYPISIKLIEEARQHFLLHHEIAVTCPVHLIHGMNDKEVPFDTSIQIAQRLSSNEVIVELVKDSDHRLSSEKDLQIIRNAVWKMVNGNKISAFK